MTHHNSGRAARGLIAAMGLIVAAGCASSPPAAGDDDRGTEEEGVSVDEPALVDAGADRPQPRDEEKQRDAEPPRLRDAGLPAAQPPTPDAGVELSDARVKAPIDASTGESSASEDECGPVTPLVADMARTMGAPGLLEIDVQPPNEFVRLQTTMIVPTKVPPASGTIFLWPGLQPMPNGANFRPLGNGVLQPVLSWGPSCAPKAKVGYESWWISALYVNLNKRPPCAGSDSMWVKPTDVLDIDMALTDAGWVQTVVDERSGEQVALTQDLMGQQQGRAFFDIELPGSAKPLDDLVFEKTILTLAMPIDAPLKPVTSGPGDYIARSRLSADGRKQCIDRIALRARGVAASTQP